MPYQRHNLRRRLERVLDGPTGVPSEKRELLVILTFSMIIAAVVYAVLFGIFQLVGIE